MRPNHAIAATYDAAGRLVSEAVRMLASATDIQYCMTESHKSWHELHIVAEGSDIRLLLQRTGHYKAWQLQVMVQIADLLRRQS